jgi:hypothetical protein
LRNGTVEAIGNPVRNQQDQCEVKLSEGDGKCSREPEGASADGNRVCADPCCREHSSRTRERWVDQFPDPAVDHGLSSSSN